jgi:hypothetical protein
MAKWIEVSNKRGQASFQAWIQRASHTTLHRVTGVIPQAQGPKRTIVRLGGAQGTNKSCWPMTREAATPARATTSGRLCH